MSETRKRIRLHEDNYLGGRPCFLTLCCQNRHPFFLDAERAAAFISILQTTSAQMSFWAHAYCVMPDHVHLLVQGREAECNLIRFVQKLKMRTGFAERKLSGRQLWQRSFYDHFVRPHDSQEGIAWYIWMNPVRKGLVTEPEEYPFSGSLTSEWKRCRGASSDAPSLLPARPNPHSPWTPPWK